MVWGLTVSDREELQTAWFEFLGGQRILVTNKGSQWRFSCIE